MSTHNAATGTDLSAKDYYIVKHDSGLKIATAHAITGAEVIAGVLGVGGGNTAGLPCRVVDGGPCKVIAGGIIGVGVKCSVDGTGRAIVAVAGDYIVGRALQAAGAANDIIDFYVEMSNWTLDTDT